MGRKVFISYKYWDTNVADLRKTELKVTAAGAINLPRKTRVRDFVDLLQEKLGEDNINLGEKDGESLKDFADSTIKSKLKEKIFQSSITVVLISKGMKENYTNESDQWIPWEVSYSLRTIVRNNSKSRMNAVLGVVIPDENNSYDWYITENSECNCTTYQKSPLFDIINSNTFNLKKSFTRDCQGITIHEGEFSFIKMVKWNQFISNCDFHIENSIKIRDDAEAYDLRINMN
jgi:hypothetical protein